MKPKHCWCCGSPDLFTHEFCADCYATNLELAAALEAVKQGAFAFGAAS